jgi:hypothetical protein
MAKTNNYLKVGTYSTSKDGRPCWHGFFVFFNDEDLKDEQRAIREATARAQLADAPQRRPGARIAAWRLTQQMPLNFARVGVSPA